MVNRDSVGDVGGQRGRFRADGWRGLRTKLVHLSKSPQLGVLEAGRSKGANYEGPASDLRPMLGASLSVVKLVVQVGRYLGYSFVLCVGEDRKLAGIIWYANLYR